MGNRFSTLTQYHSLITAHGVLAAITFLFLVPLAVMTKRFRRAPHESVVRTHSYLNVLAIGFSTVVFVLGFFAVGPSRSLTNPHHGIGVAIYVLILLQALGGRMIMHIRKGHSFRAHVHRWSGRTVGLLGVVQVPLGLTLYGSPRYTFVLYALWMAFLVLVYFVLSYRHENRGSGEYVEEEYRRERKEKKSGMGWLGPLAAGGAALALLRGRRKAKERSRERSRSGSRSRARSVSRVRSRSRGAPEVIPSRRGSDSYVDEKYEERRRSSGGGGGFMSKALGVGAAAGAGALFSKFLGRKDRDRHDEEYSAVATDTPSRHRSRRHRPAPSEYSDDYTVRSGHGGSILPPPNPTATAAALSAAEVRPGASGARPPMTPQRSHHGRSAVDSHLDASDYSSYVSPSRRASERKKSGGVGKGLLAGLGLGWFAKKMKDRRDYREEDRLREEEDDRRAGHRGSRYTADGYPSPSRSHSRRHRPGRPTAPPSGVTTTLSDESSYIEPRPPSGYTGPPTTGAMPPPPPMGHVPPQAPIPVTPVGLRASRSGSRSRHDVVDPVVMPPMPTDPHGMLHESGSESYFSSGGHPHRRHSSRRRKEGEAAAAAAVAAASRLAEEERRKGESGPGHPVSVKVNVDPDRNVTLRRVPPGEQEATRRQERSRRRDDDSVSSLSATETAPSSRRYRRESSRGRAEAAAERIVDPHRDDEPLAPPNPAFAHGRRPKDSAYYSGQPGPSGGTPAAGATVSSLGSPGSHGTWSAMSPSPSGPLKEGTASAADRRRRRRLERRDGSRQPSGTVEFS
jgi:hypothetical protein